MDPFVLNHIDFKLLVVYLKHLIIYLFRSTANLTRFWQVTNDKIAEKKMMTGKNIDRGKKCIEKACIQKLKMCNKHLFRLCLL